MVIYVFVRFLRGVESGYFGLVLVWWFSCLLPVSSFRFVDLDVWIGFGFSGYLVCVCWCCLTCYVGLMRMVFVDYCLAALNV